MINAATGFRRTDLAKIALARSYGATTFQVFRKIRFPLALPMIIVGYMVGSIFGLLTAVGSEMASASEEGGLGHQLIYFSSLIQVPAFWATIESNLRSKSNGISSIFWYLVLALRPPSSSTCLRTATSSKFFRPD